MQVYYVCRNTCAEYRRLTIEQARSLLLAGWYVELAG